ncbi:MAG: FkbM family methyltransferase [Muribaculaceae bacterium]|nr:FkbM family methyltransferase [Muribaculaceae bacterium]
MDYSKNLLPQLAYIRDNLQDEESKIIFDARVQFLFTRSEDVYYDILEKVRKKSRCKELEDFIKENEGYQEIIIYGAGTEGRRLKKLLDSCDTPATYFCDNNDALKNLKIENLEIITTKQLLENYTNSVVILSAQSEMFDTYRLLLRCGFPRKKILLPMHLHLVASNGIQYFDVFSPIKDEIFVDAGSYDGDTIRKFVEWTNGQYKKIYAFEPNKELGEILLRNVKEEKIENVIFTPEATWEKKADLNFVNDSASSRVNKCGEFIVKATDIDSIVGDAKVTYIKMDVEGSELESLIGAHKTIMRNKPRLAISVYHKPGDTVELADYILKLNLGYKLLLRQYNSNFWETILYAY